MKLTLAVAALIGTNAVQIGHRHHHKHQNQHQSIPACNSHTFPRCVGEAETAAPQKLQADMDHHDKDYFVPNFGVDHDVITTQSNLKNAEASVGHQWKLAQHQSIPACDSSVFPNCVKEAETAAPQKLQADMDHHDKDYFVPNFGVDHDVITTQSNLKNSEAKLGHTWKLAQAISIPACNSSTFPKCVTEAETAAPTKLQADQDKHDKDYFVPNFGVDHDVITTQANLKNTEAKLGHTMQPASLAQSVPACNSYTHPKCKDAETAAPDHLAPLWYQAAQLEQVSPSLSQITSVPHPVWVSNVQLNSDPICNSWKCSQYLHPESREQYPINYTVPDFGMDKDIKITQTNYKAAEEAAPTGTFVAQNIAPDAYDAEFELKPIWERKPDYGSGMDKWLRK